MAGALEGVRVADFTHILNGPFCTMLLGHLGAEIIKIEPPAAEVLTGLLGMEEAEFQRLHNEGVVQARQG